MLGRRVCVGLLVFRCADVLVLVCCDVGPGAGAGASAVLSIVFFTFATNMAMTQQCRDLWELDGVKHGSLRNYGAEHLTPVLGAQ